METVKLNTNLKALFTESLNQKQESVFGFGQEPQKVDLFADLKTTKKFFVLPTEYKVFEKTENYVEKWNENKQELTVEYKRKHKNNKKK
ncbi:hypothetical protein HDV06_004890 [Boothiomyces sp. JEL0866]|nr:hypothetical protein HDV06_004890 [Boothiomyces sp. JEL0866]